MSAWDQPIVQNTGGNYKKTRWYTWGSGHDYMRIIGEPHIVDTHPVPTGGKMPATVKCLGEACPICKDNQRLWAEYGSDARDNGYINKAKRAYFNVVDRSVGKICPNTECGAEVKKVRGSIPTACPKCNTVLTGVEAKKLNVVRVVNVSANPGTTERPGTFNKMIAVISQVVDENGKQLPLDSYDFCFNTVGTGMDRRSEPEVPETINTESVEYSEEDLNDLSRAYITFTAEEITQLRTGVQVRDIFAARKGTVVETPKAEVSVEQAADLQDRIAKMMDEDTEVPWTE